VEELGHSLLAVLRLMNDSDTGLVEKVEVEGGGSNLRSVSDEKWGQDKSATRLLEKDRQCSNLTV